MGNNHGKTPGLLYCFYHMPFLFNSLCVMHLQVLFFFFFLSLQTTELMWVIDCGAGIGKLLKNNPFGPAIFLEGSLLKKN